MAARRLRPAMTASALEPRGEARFDGLDKTEFSSLFSTPRLETLGHFMSLTFCKNGLPLGLLSGTSPARRRNSMSERILSIEYCVA